MKLQNSEVIKTVLKKIIRTLSLSALVVVAGVFVLETYRYGYLSGYEGGLKVAGNYYESIFKKKDSTRYEIL